MLWRGYIKVFLPIELVELVRFSKIFTKNDFRGKNMKMQFKCAKCEKDIKDSQASIFHMFEHYHLSCLGHSKKRMAQVICRY